MLKRNRKTVRSKMPSPKATRISTFARVPKVLGAGLFLTAALIGIAAVSSPVETLQAVAFRSALPAGTKLTNADLQTIELPKSAELSNYQITTADLVGKELLHAVSAQMLATRTDVSSFTSALQELTLSFDQKSLPAKISIGDVFDLWVIPQNLAGNITGTAQLVIAELPVAALAELSANISVEIPITFFILPEQIAPVLDAISAGKPYLVRR
jgi:hypothetical protein